MTAGGALPAFLAGTLGVQVKADLGISDTGLGVAVAAMFGSATFVAARAGRFADLLGWQRAVYAVSGMSVVCMVGAALFGHSYPALLGWLLVGGVGFAMATPAANLLVARTIPAGRRGFALGLKQGAVPLSTLIAGLAVPAVGLTLGWRWAFGIAVVLPLTAIVLVPRTAQPLHRPGDAGSVAFVAPRSLHLLAWAGALATLSVGALHGFVVVSAVAAGVKPATAGFLVGVASVVGIAVRVAAGWRIDRVAADGFRGVAVLVGLGAIGYVLLALQSAPLVAPGMLLAFGAGWGWPGLFQYGLVVTFPRDPGSASGVIQTGFTAGTAAGPIAFGLAADRVGYGSAWLGVAACCAVAALLIDRAAAGMRVAVGTRGR